MINRPITTLYLLVSVDGKISTGCVDALDVDKDFPKIKGVAEGLHQYYEIEQTMDLWSFNTGRVMQKIGCNERPLATEHLPVSFVLLDNKPHMTESGIRYLCSLLKQLVLVTENKNHPALSMHIDNLSVIVQEKTDLPALLTELKTKYGVDRLTVQSGGTINQLFLHQKLLDYVDLVVAPVLIGGKDTMSLIAGKSLSSPDELGLLGVLKLEKCDVLKDSYLRLRYKVIG